MTIELKFKYGEKIEFRRVKETLARLDWYNAHGYKPRLPGGVTSESLEEEIKRQIAEEFDENRYLKAIEVINDGFASFNKQFDVYRGDIRGEYQRRDVSDLVFGTGRGWRNVYDI